MKHRKITEFMIWIHKHLIKGWIAVNLVSRLGAGSHIVTSLSSSLSLPPWREETRREGIKKVVTLTMPKKSHVKIRTLFGKHSSEISLLSWCSRFSFPSRKINEALKQGLRRTHKDKTLSNDKTCKTILTFLTNRWLGGGFQGFIESNADFRT